MLFGKVFAQKFGYVDSDYIMNQMPEYKEAQSRDCTIVWKLAR